MTTSPLEQKKEKKIVAEIADLIRKDMVQTWIRPDGQIGYAPAWWNPDGERDEIQRENDKKVC